MPAAVLVTAVLIGLTSDFSAAQFATAWPTPLPVMPQFTFEALVGIALPLFIVTMASQNIPGMAVLNANGYRPDAGVMFRTTGLFSLAGAPFGGHAVNLAAITAALCANAEAHPDPDRRYWAAVIAGSTYVLFGLLAGLATAFIAASPPILIEAVAGLALIGAFMSAIMGMVADKKDSEAAVVTFLVTASGLTLFGIGGAFWGLIAGAAMHALARAGRGRTGSGP